MSISSDLEIDDEDASPPPFFNFFSPHCSLLRSFFERGRYAFPGPGSLSNFLGRVVRWVQFFFTDSFGDLVLLLALPTDHVGLTA